MRRVLAFVVCTSALILSANGAPAQSNAFQRTPESGAAGTASDRADRSCRDADRASAGPDTRSVADRSSAGTASTEASGI